MAGQFCSMDYNEFPVPYLSDKTPEAVFHGQAVKTVACLRVSTAQDTAVVGKVLKARWIRESTGGPDGASR